MRTTVDDSKCEVRKFPDGAQVRVWRGLDDDWRDDIFIGRRGIVAAREGDGNYEVTLDGETEGTHSFFEYQLEELERSTGPRTTSGA